MSTRCKEREQCSGYMTVYLSLTMAVLLSLCLTMIEGARSNAIILESEIACDIALNSVMSEYSRELMKQYNIFAIEDSYGSNNASLDNVDAHLTSYLNNNFSANHFLGFILNYRDFLGIEVESALTDGVLYLTDDTGAVFMRRAYEALKDDIGMTLLSEIQEWTTDIESSGLEDMDLQNQMYLLEEKVENAQEEASENEQTEEAENSDQEESGSEEVGTEISVVNPAPAIISALNQGITYRLIDDENSVSSKYTDVSNLISARMRNGETNLGNLTLEESNGVEAAIERYVFQEYLMKYMGNYMETGAEDNNSEDENAGDELSYQIEYIIAGYGSDKENFETVLARIFAIRFAAAYLYVQNDDDIQTYADLFATAISVLTYTEELKDVYKEIYLLVWSENEAAYDTKSLLAGNRVELIKTSDNRHVNEMLQADDDYSGDGAGLSYEDYLRVFLTFMTKNNLVARAMDMVEADIRNTTGNSNFRIDACIDTIHISVKIQSTFGYSYSFALKRKYE